MTLIKVTLFMKEYVSKRKIALVSLQLVYCRSNPLIMCQCILYLHIAGVTFEFDSYTTTEASGGIYVVLKASGNLERDFFLQLALSEPLSESMYNKGV